MLISYVNTSYSLREYSVYHGRHVDSERDSSTMPHETDLLESAK